MVDYTQLGLGMLLVYILCGLAYIVVWIYTLVKQGKAKDWIWFVFTLIFGTIPLVLWWFVGKESPLGSSAAKQCKSSGGKWKEGKCTK